MSSEAAFQVSALSDWRQKQEQVWGLEKGGGGFSGLGPGGERIRMMRCAYF